MYAGAIESGIAWLFFVVIGYTFMIIPGVILHLLCIVGAADAARNAGRPSAVHTVTGPSADATTPTTDPPRSSSRVLSADAARMTA